MNIYLDIDGVLLANDLNPALHSEEFLEYVLTNFPYSTYWLTTHCQGDANTPIEHIGHLFSDRAVDLMRQIKPTQWETAKTRAIDLHVPFLWFDDDLFYEEQVTLEAKGLMDNWIGVDLVSNPNQLANFISSFPLYTKNKLPSQLNLSPIEAKKYNQK